MTENDRDGTDRSHLTRAQIQAAAATIGAEGFVVDWQLPERVGGER